MHRLRAIMLRRVVGAALALPVVLLARVVRPLRVIRFGPIRADRLGHLALEPEVYLCERDAGLLGRRTIDRFHMVGPYCNDQLVTMWRRVLNASDVWRAADRLNQRMPGGKRHVVPYATVDLNHLLERTPPHLEFTDAERSRGQRERSALGVPAEAPHVCLIGRDAAYLDAVLSQYQWGYHEYRDTQIETYVDAAEELVERGYHVLRMGAVVARRMPVSHDSIIDYATTARSDFMDLWLFATCHFMIASSSGPCMLGAAFRRPIAFANVAPLLTVVMPPIPMGRLFIPKSYRRIDGDRPMTLAEIMAAGGHEWGLGSDYERAGARPVDNTAQEIADLAREMDERERGVWPSSSEDEELQHAFWSACGRDDVLRDTKIRVGAYWLRQHAAELGLR